MFIVYKFLINIVFLLSPIIVLIRLIKGKEDINRFQEKLGFFKKEKKNGNLVWLHGASVGEIQSIVPLIEKFENDKKIKQILITSNTLSSSFIIKDIKLKKTIHQYFPIDCNFISKKFLNYWKPSKVFFVGIIPISLLNRKLSGSFV